jgi:hypothetical protein
MNPKVSVLMPAYNAERYVRPAVESVLAQSFRDYELLAIDDASTDSTLEILRSYEDSRLRMLRNPRNLGVLGSLQAGLAAARGSLVARFDADDLCDPRRLEQQVEYMDSHPEVTLLGTACELIDSEGKHIGRFCPPTLPAAVEWELLFHNTVVHSSVMFRREPVMALGGYREQVPHVEAEDYELWSRIAASGRKIVQLSQPLVSVRRHSAQTSDMGLSKVLAVTYRIAQGNVERLIGRAVRLDVLACLACRPPAGASWEMLHEAYDTLRVCWDAFVRQRVPDRGELRQMLSSTLPVLLVLARTNESRRMTALRCGLRFAVRAAPRSLATREFLRFATQVAAPVSLRNAWHAWREAGMRRRQSALPGDNSQPA